MSAEEQPRDDDPMSERERVLMILEIVEALLKHGPKAPWVLRGAMMAYDGGHTRGPEAIADLRRQLRDDDDTADWKRPAEWAW